MKSSTRAHAHTAVMSVSHVTDVTMILDFPVIKLAHNHDPHVFVVL